MFDLIAGNTRHGFHDPTATPTIISVAAHALIVLAIVVLPVLRATHVLPPVAPAMMAFFATPATAPPPPPPPPAPAAAAHPAPRPLPNTGKLAAPIDAPPEVRPESAIDAREGTAGVVGGVEGGVPGGVVGGIVGGIVSAVALPPPPPPPPPPPAPAQAGPVRIGGIITAPALLHRVEPVYPNIAVAAKLGGVVILEATVGTDGCVESVRVLRSRGFLDASAIQALKQWRYSPLILDGVPVSFVLTVTFSFSVQ